MRIHRNLSFFLIGCIVIGLLACSASKRSKASADAAPPANATAADWLKTYEAKLGIQLEPNMNRQLLDFVSEWMGVPYRYGGSSKDGTDCSGFIGQVYPQVYGVPVPRTTTAIFNATRQLRMEDTRDGDLVFFRINAPAVSHAGIYLCAGYFIHASTSKGVMISNLNEAYWKKYYAGAGRMVP